MSESLVDKVARALVWEQYQGCVSWEDTDDTATTGSAQTRAYARDHARAAIRVVFDEIEPIYMRAALISNSDATDALEELGRALVGNEWDALVSEWWKQLPPKGEHG